MNHVEVMPMPVFCKMHLDVTGRKAFLAGARQHFSLEAKPRVAEGLLP